MTVRPYAALSHRRTSSTTSGPDDPDSAATGSCHRERGALYCGLSRNSAIAIGDPGEATCSQHAQRLRLIAGRPSILRRLFGTSPLRDGKSVIYD